MRDATKRAYDRAMEDQGTRISENQKRPTSGIVTACWVVGAIAIAIGLMGLMSGASDGTKIAGFGIIGGLVAVAVGLIINAIEKSSGR